MRKLQKLTRQNEELKRELLETAALLTALIREMAASPVLVRVHGRPPKE